MKPYQHLHFLPIAVVISIPVTFFLTYTWAVLLEHVEAGFPYISDTGTFSPESCVFSQFVNLSAATMAICVYVRYRQVSEHMKVLPSSEKKISRNLNLVAGWLGALSCLGLDIVGNFQETNVRVVHFIGASVCFAGGTVYFCMQTYFSYRMQKSEIVGKCTLYIRGFMSVFCILCVLGTTIPAYILKSYYGGTDKMKWVPEDKGYGWHLASTVSEWSLAIMFCGFLLSYVKEFSCTTLEPPVVRVTYPGQRKASCDQELVTVQVQNGGAATSL